MIVSFYDTDGRFVQSIEGDLDRVIAPSAAVGGLPYIEGRYGADDWFHEGQTKKRPACPATLDGATLCNVPSNSVIAINRRQYPCPEGGDVELEFDQPGTYRIRVTGWPYLDGEFTYENPPH